MVKAGNHCSWDFTAELFRLNRSSESCGLFCGKPKTLSKVSSKKYAFEEKKWVTCHERREDLKHRRDGMSRLASSRNVPLSEEGAKNWV